MSFDLPRTLTLPSGTRVTLRRTSTRHEPVTHAAGTPLFAEVLALFDHEVRITKGTDAIDVRDLSLADFHVVRAFLVKAGLVHEDEVELDCHNCGELLVTRPCAGLETGPWEDNELGDPELDVTAELGVPLDVPPIRLGRVRQAKTITLAARTVREAMPFWTALGKDPLEIDERVVQSMGVVALGPIAEPEQIARILADDRGNAFDAVSDVFLAAHYPLRLACDAFCPKCKARNTVDAPAERELTPSNEHEDTSYAPEHEAHGSLPPLDEFVELAHTIAEPLIADIPGEKVQLIVEDGTPAVDDGGEPLLGSYVPPPSPEALMATAPPTVTVYYQTFVKATREDAEFDWDAELRETIEHELEHHVFHLRGDDPMDEEEHAEIDREAVRVIGRNEATRRTLAVFGTSIPDFFRRAWPLLLLAAVALAISLAEGRCE